MHVRHSVPHLCMHVGGVRGQKGYQVTVLEQQALLQDGGVGLGLAQ